MKKYIAIVIAIILVITILVNMTYSPTSQVVIQTPDSAKTVVTGLDAPGDYAFELVVTDDSGAIDRDTVIVHVIPRALPLKLESFKGQERPTMNYLEWISTWERNIDKYELLYGVDGNNFQTLTFVPAKNTASRMVYNCEHRNPPPLCFYRIRIYEKDGSKTFSNTVTISRQKKSQLIITNPVSNQLRVVLESQRSGTATIAVVDVQGRVYALPPMPVNAGVSERTYGISNLAAGTYVLRVIAPDGTFSKQFIKLN